ncbi:hypothetical protein Tdes44962_MAKER08696 [Teratosphaeria destructans]|uniref:ZZ-type domain-containing protein n=1 Tax=Teratosphaeria destructans TaxID=418781 RepID=A0A9W7W479_9PEZI|nr:hypothetical protein Tdes44962_MAKER08696 [Teratosphaeria destructans]
MAASAHNQVPMDTLITIKVSVNDSLKKLKLPLRDLGANVLPDKLRHLLQIKPEQTVVFERFSDSAGGYITLDPNNPHVFKTLIRAAKAKLKLRLKATVTPVDGAEERKEVDNTPQKTQPVIVRSPICQNKARDSTAFDRRSVGSGIFQFRDARNSEQALVDTTANEAPVPRPFNVDRSDFFNHLNKAASQIDLAIRPKEPASRPSPLNIASYGHPWSVYCNECDNAMADAHFHCSTCDGGDYDLCEDCVAGGKLCPGEHWLIKRFIQDGKVVNSTTERVAPRAKESEPVHSSLAPAVVPAVMPGSFAEDIKPVVEAASVPSPTRTCNSCVVVLPEREFVTCTSCEDFDLCISCHSSNSHGHHPAHGFEPATEDTILPAAAENTLAPGRNVRHNAICDGCDQKIYGVRHKCLNCPDWDYCGDCFSQARHFHPRHRFAAIYEPLPDQVQPAVRHYGIYCDGPLCTGKSDQSYITGVRYKCAVCHDTDFCASCEALPISHHNHTHPLIKFKTPVRNVSITTENEDLRGNVRMMGDRKSTATEAPRAASSPSEVQTLAEIKPIELKQEVKKVKEVKPKIFSIPVVSAEEKKAAPASSSMNSALLNAYFVQDSIPDGMILPPGARFTQIWTVKKPRSVCVAGGCSVRYVGGDNMLNVDNRHPASVSDIAEATESNVAGREVQVNEEIAFKVILKAPLREGKSISYWRLKAADGTPFGHRLWCDIEVKQPEIPMPAPILAGAIPLSKPVDPTLAMSTRQHDLQRAQTQRAEMQRVVQAHTLQMQQAVQNQRAKAGGAAPAYEATPSANSELGTRLSAMRQEQQRRQQAFAAMIAGRQNKAQVDSVIPQYFPSAAGPSTAAVDDRARKEAAKQRVEHIKAKIMRTREERAKAMMQAQRATSVEQKTAEARKIIEEVSRSAAAEEKAEAEKVFEKTEEMEGSQMVFPKLEKESPASSTYQSATSSSNKGKAAYVENEEGEVEQSAVPSVASATSQAPVEDLEDDIEVLSAADGDDSDDGFITDEEYDVLDASDAETIA